MAAASAAAGATVAAAVGSRALPLRLPILSVVVAACAMTFALVDWRNACRGGAYCAEAQPVALAILVLVAAITGLLVLAAALTGRRKLSVLVAFAVALLATVPVRGRWSDGCNGHSAVVPAVATPHVWLAKPTRAFAYTETSTLMACS